MIELLEYFAQRRKAIVAFITPPAVLFIADASDGSLPTHAEWVSIGVLAVATAVGVHYVPNAPASEDD